MRANNNLVVRKRGITEDMPEAEFCGDFCGGRLQVSVRVGSKNKL